MKHGAVCREFSWSDREIYRLSGYRTAVAAQCEGPVLRIGKGWDERPARQNLPDLHLDKLAQVDGKVRLLPALENTHLAHCITEKPFDALATGAVPLCLAMPSHRIFERIPAAAMLNICGLEPPEATKAVAAFATTIQTAEAWLAACRAIVALLGDVPTPLADRSMCMDRVLAALRSVV